MSLKNKLFSFFKIKINMINKTELNKIIYEYISKEKEMEKEPERDEEQGEEQGQDQQGQEEQGKEEEQGQEDNKITNNNLEIDNIYNDDANDDANNEEDISMIHASFTLNNIIDKIVTDTYGVCDKKTYVKDISDFYIYNLNYYSLRDVMTTTNYHEFVKYIEAILHKSLDVMYTLRSIKLYDNDLTYCSYRAGVFKTDNFIIKIDLDPCNFKNEITAMYNLGKGLIEEHSVVVPYHAQISSKNKKNINFSIQPRIHNTISLRDWMMICANKQLDIEFYISLCIRISKSILFINSKHVVHGDIKPDNIIIENTTNRPYIIDFGLCGLHDLSEGTGGTKPFCHPETLNIDESDKDNTEYNWVKNTKNNDLWSISFIFATILIFRKCYIYYKDYPADFFDQDKYISINYLNYIPEKFRAPFVYVLAKSEVDVSIDIQSFISLLEKAL
jgi:hypothetical protein